MRYFIDEPSGCAYWLENDAIEGDVCLFAPLLSNGTFNTDDGKVVEEWLLNGLQDRVMQALKPNQGKEIKCTCGSKTFLVIEKLFWRAEQEDLAHSHITASKCSENHNEIVCDACGIEYDDLDVEFV